MPAPLPGMPRVVPPTWCDNSLQGRGELCPSLFCWQRNQGVQCLSLEGEGYSKGKMLGSCERWRQRANLGVATPRRKSNLSFFPSRIGCNLLRILTLIVYCCSQALVKRAHVASHARVGVVSEYIGRSTGFSVWGSHGREPVRFRKYEVQYLSTNGGSQLVSVSTSVNETQSWQGRLLIEMPKRNFCFECRLDYPFVTFHQML